MAGAAIFGKLPLHGDFVARGLPAGLRGALDRWLTRHLARRAHAPQSWPPGGLRATLILGGDSLSALILPSMDRAGRAFPLACCYLPGLAWEDADGWCDAATPTARAACDGALSADSLQAALAALPAPDIDLPDPGIWATDEPDATDAPVEAVLAALMGPLSSDGSYSL